MRIVTIQHDFASWRSAARELLQEGVQPENVLWVEASAGQSVLPLEAGGEPTDAAPPAGSAHRVPAEFVAQARIAACHRSAGRWPLLYRLLYRLTHGAERGLLSIRVDPDVHALEQLTKAVRRDVHKMKAFVRFRRVTGAGPDKQDHYVAWHRPDHRIVRLAAPFFARRFGVMRWTIFTPDESADWDGKRVAFGPGVPQSALPSDDGLEELWRVYYGNIFNPARVKRRAMVREMPVRHWRTLPEAEIIERILREAPQGVENMMARRATPTVTAADFLPPPEQRALPQLGQAASGCRGCELYASATQTVFGEGPPDAAGIFIGEQPGDQEDLGGRPFIGPAGQVLDRALAGAGIARQTIYLTNAVKHFHWAPRGKRRLHAKPTAVHLRACRPWLEAELAALQPQLVVCLGSTAAQSLLGAGFRVTQQRGQVLRDTGFAPALMATIHPSAILRMPDEAARESAYAQFVDDLKVAAGVLAEANGRK